MLLIIFGSFIGAIALVGCLMYIIIMGPSRYHRDGIIGRLHRLLTTIPLNVCGLCVSCFFGCNQRKGRQCCSRCAAHTLHERNWFMVVFYIALVWTVEVLYLFVSLPWLQVSLLSKSVSWGLVIVSEFLWGCAVFVDPGTVTAEAELEAQRHRFASVAEASGTGAEGGKKKGGPAPPPAAAAATAARRGNRRGGGASAAAAAAAATGRAAASAPVRRFVWSPVEEYVLNNRYIVDGMVYAASSEEAALHRTAAQRSFASPTVGYPIGLGQSCTTCHVPRPSRSKHCRLCHRCVRRFDHHCPWINNDVAERTMRYFLGFLLCHALSCTWACYDLFRSIRQFLKAHHAWGWVLRRPYGREVPLTVAHYMMILINYHMLEACLMFFAVCIGLVLYGFWGYQMSFAVANLTVNDLNKIDDTVDFVATLPTLDLVYREARKVRERLQQVAERKPKALLALEEPPLPKTEPGYEEGGKRNVAYRKRVRKMLTKDLKGLYDRGVVRNLLEILFPDSPFRDEAVMTQAAACVR